MMDGHNNKEFNQASINFMGLAQFHNVVKDEPQGTIPGHTLQNLKTMEDIVRLEENVRDLKLKSSEMNLEENVDSLNLRRGILLEVVLRLKHDLEFLVKNREKILEMQAAERQLQGEALRCKTPQLLVHAVKGMSQAIADMGLHTNPLPDAAILEEVLKNVEQECSEANVSELNLKRCLDLMNTIMPLYPINK